MSIERRRFLRLAGSLVAVMPFRAASGIDVVEIEMNGRRDGSRVWFDPIGVHVRPGQLVRWVNRDPVNVHTASAYHPDNDGHLLRIPEGAPSWNSGYLRFGEKFEIRVMMEGVYDYYCHPHERAGMVGRIVVGDGPFEDHGERSPAGSEIPQQALTAFPDARTIVSEGVVRLDDKVVGSE